MPMSSTPAVHGEGELHLNHPPSLPLTLGCSLWFAGALAGSSIQVIIFRKKKKKKKVWSFSYSVVHNWVDTKPARQNNAAQLTFLFQNSKWKLPAKESPLYVRPSLWEVGKIQTDRFLFQGWSAPVPTLSGVTNMCKWTVQVNFILFCCKQR